jgi:hypothetical protein
MDLSKVQLRCRCQLLMVLQLLLAISGSDHALQLMQRQQVLSAWDHKKAEGRQQEGHPTDPEKQPSVAPRRKPWALLVLVAPLRKPWALLVLVLLQPLLVLVQPEDLVLVLVLVLQQALLLPDLVLVLVLQQALLLLTSPRLPPCPRQHTVALR